MLSTIVLEPFEADVAELETDPGIQQMASQINQHGPIERFEQAPGVPTDEFLLQASRRYHDSYADRVHARAAFGAIAVAVLRQARRTSNTTRKEA